MYVANGWELGQDPGGQIQFPAFLLSLLVGVGKVLGCMSFFRSFFNYEILWLYNKVPPSGSSQSRRDK